MSVLTQPHVSAQGGDPFQTSFRVTVPLLTSRPAAVTLDAAIAAWVFAPDDVPAPKAVWYLAIPGWSYRGLAYFDRQVPGYAPDTFSMARFLARHGMGLVVIDTLGTGESQVAVDGELITRVVTAEANAQVLSQMRERLLAGRLVPDRDAVSEDALFLGVIGHSMGAFQAIQLAALLEERGTPLDAAIFAGWSHGSVDYDRLHLDAHALLTQLVATNGQYAVPRALMRPLFYGPSPTVPAALIEADERDAVTFPKGLLDEGLLPGIVAQEARMLRCPVLSVAAAHDLCANAQAEGEVFSSSRLFTAYTQHAAAHCNFEESRQEFWQVLVGWSKMVAAWQGEMAADV